jgi:hypothetical protein
MRLFVLLLMLITTLPATAAEVKILLPQNRAAFQTNEWIDISVMRTAPQPLAASPVILKLTGADGSVIESKFAASAKPQGANQVLHYHINGWLLRPGKYTVEATTDGATGKAEIEVYSHIRQSDFRLINWGRATKQQQLAEGEDGFGFNLFYGGYGSDDDANFIRAGVDFMSCCTMSGAHQMDIRMECDWSDPYVTRGGTRRVARRAMIDRTRPNVPGVHFYDEPGLTWGKHPVTGEFGPHEIPAQIRAYVSAFGKPPLPSNEVDPKNPEHVARWKQWATWKLGFMDAAWREAQFGVSQVRGDFLSATQSQYGWSAFTDGYYFNVVRSLPVTSGHGGYHDFGPGYFNPSYFLEMARARDFWKPNWYLPTWYGNTTADQFRMEQYLSFQMNIRGMISPPDCEPATNALPRQGIVESNQLMKKLGPIFTTMAPTRPPVAMLYSLSQAIHTQTLDRSQNYAHSMPQGEHLPLTYLAGKLIQHQFSAVMDEDILDGTLAANHKAVILTSIDYLDPQVITALEKFVQNGGKVLMTGDSTVQIQGALKLAVAPKMPDQAKIDEIMKAKKYDQLGPFTTVGKWLEGAKPLAAALKAELQKAEIKTIAECDVPTIVFTRHAAGDIEYIFAVNATYDSNAKDAKGEAEKNALAPVVAKIRLPADGGVTTGVYDAIRGGEIPQFKAVERSGEFRFGPGEMRVFARTKRAIGHVILGEPVLTAEPAAPQSSIQVACAANVHDNKEGLVSGSVPLRIRLVDPLGVTRFEMYRATKFGHCDFEFPLAANDPAGVWGIVVTELLGNNEDLVRFPFTPPAQVRSIVGETPRAVYAGNDRDNVFRFVRLFHDVTIVKGKSPYDDAAAKRLAKILEPWGVRCKEMPLTDAAKSRKLTEDEARTWCGLVYAGSGQIKPGDGNPPALAGFAVQGPVILLGTPEDNPIIDFLLKEKFLPYSPKADSFPGPNRGMLAWQRDGIGPGQESITLIGYDEAGMGEAVGSFYEAAAGIDPLMKYRLPESVTITPAKTTPGLYSKAAMAWTQLMPDRIVAMKAEGGGVQVLSHDGSLVTISSEGKKSGARALNSAEAAQLQMQMAVPADSNAAMLAKKQERPDRMQKLIAASDRKLAVAYWGGTLRVADADGKILSEQQVPQDVTAMTWLDGKLVAGLADGRVMALELGK